MDSLEKAMGVNAYDKEYSYVEGLKDPEDISGGYLLEIDSVYYIFEKSWFSFGEGFYWTSKSPEYLSESMCEYISEYCNERCRYIVDERLTGGDGSELFQYFDRETFVKYFLTMEWFDNKDAWTSSTYIYKKKGEDKLYAGPVWDCDAIMGARDSEKNPAGWKSQVMGDYLLALPEFRKAMREIYIEEIRPVIYDILLGDADGIYLKTYEHMKEEVSASRAMNDMIWEYNDMKGDYFHEETAEENYDLLYELMETRAEWFDQAIMAEDFVESLRR